MVSWQPRFYERSRWFAPIAPAAARFARMAAWPSVAEIDRALGADAGVRFVSAAKGRGYEERIVEEGIVPTREESWHDFLNALVWAVFPRAKSALTRRLYRLLAARRGADGRLANRSPDEDWLALFDEGGVALVDEDSLVFGHALYEHLIRGESVRGRAVRVAEGAVDERLAEALEASPLPQASSVPVGG